MDNLGIKENFLFCKISQLISPLLLSYWKVIFPSSCHCAALFHASAGAIPLKHQELGIPSKHSLLQVRHSVLCSDLKLSEELCVFICKYSMLPGKGWIEYLLSN